MNKVTDFAKNHWGKIALITSAVILTGLIAAPFIYDSKKTLEVMNSGLNSMSSLIKKTGLSNSAFFGILAGIIAVICVAVLAGLYIKGRTLKAMPIDPTSLTIKEGKIDIQYNPYTFRGENFDTKKTDLQALLSANISEKVEAQDKVDEVKDTGGNITTHSKAVVEGKEAVACGTLIFNMGDVASTDENPLAVAQKLVDQIDVSEKCLIVQFNDGYFDIIDPNKKVLGGSDDTTKVELDIRFKSVPEEAKNDQTTRTVNVTLARHNEIFCSTFATTVHDGLAKAWNFTIGRVDCMKAEMAKPAQLAAT